MIKTVFFAVALSLGVVARADSPAPASVLTVSSFRGDVMVRVAPPRGDSKPEALVFDYDADKCTYTLRSRFQLRNQFMPYRVAVAPNAKYIVAVEEYGALSYGSDSIVVYDGAGRVLWQWGFSEIFTEAEVTQIPASTSSRWWVDSVTIIPSATDYVAFIVPPAEIGDRKPSFLRVVVDLATGKLTKY